LSKANVASTLGPKSAIVTSKSGAKLDNHPCKEVAIDSIDRKVKVKQVMLEKIFPIFPKGLLLAFGNGAACNVYHSYYANCL